MKKVAVIGTGVVGQVLADGFLKHGYEVIRTSRDLSKLEAWQKGERECLTAAVLASADSGDQVRTLGKAFKGRTDWREFIKEERGRCWIDV